MNLRIIIFSILCGLSAMAVKAESLIEQADSAYMNDDFAKAADLYLEAESQEGSSSDLYYNIGNCYYRQNKLGKAILYYERALRLDPSNKYARMGGHSHSKLHPPVRSHSRLHLFVEHSAP